MIKQFLTYQEFLNESYGIYRRGRSINGQNTSKKTASECSKIIKRGITPNFILNFMPCDEWHHSDRAKIGGLPTNFYDLEIVENLYSKYKEKDYSGFLEYCKDNSIFEDLVNLKDVEKTFKEWENYENNKKTFNSYENIGKLAILRKRDYGYKKGRYVLNGETEYMGVVTKQTPNLLTINVLEINGNPQVSKNIITVKGKDFEITPFKNLEEYRKEKLRIENLRIEEQKEKEKLNTEEGLIDFIKTIIIKKENENFQTHLKNDMRKWVAVSEENEPLAIVYMHSKPSGCNSFEKFREIAKKELSNLGKVISTY